MRAARLSQDKSLLDSVNDRVNQLQRKLGAADNRKVNDYLASLRDVERRIQKAEEQSSKELPDVAQPAGIPEKFEDHVRLLYDLQLLAYQSDLTRVITFMYGREQTGRPYPQIGVPEPHHPLTHHQGNPEKMEKCAKIQRLSHRAVCRVSGKVAQHAGWRWLAAGSCDPSFWLGHQQQRPAHARSAADVSGGRRRRDAEGRPSPGLSGTHAARRTFS